MDDDRDVEVDPYDPAWPGLFAAEAAALRDRLGPAVVAVQHIGSTAIPGLAAKPIIDLMVGVERLSMDDDLVSDLKDYGYEYFGEFGIPGRHFFRKGRNPRTHHLHWVALGGDFWNKQILFRDYILAHPAEAKAYENLKRDLARKFAHDRDSYTKSKTAFVETALARAREWEKT